MVAYILTGCGAVALAAFLAVRDKRGSVLATILKTVTSLCFIGTGVAAGVSCLLGQKEWTLMRILPVFFIVLGLVFGMVGDIFLDYRVYFRTLKTKLPELEKDFALNMFAGMGAFGIGHIFYLAATLLMQPKLWTGLLLSAGIGAVLVALIMIVGSKVMKMNFGRFFPACIMYGFLLASFVVFSIIRLTDGYSLAKVILLIGAILFIASDLILCMIYFSREEDYQKTGPLNPESRLMIGMNHVAYYGAQFMIALSLLFL